MRRGHGSGCDFVKNASDWRIVLDDCLPVHYSGSPVVFGLEKDFVDFRELKTAENESIVNRTS